MLFFYNIHTVNIKQYTELIGPRIIEMEMLQYPLELFVWNKYSINFTEF